MEDSRHFQEKIRYKYSEMTKSQIKLSHYILENSSEVPFLSSAQLAKKVCVSEATVNRFCLAIGYSGYLDFQRDMRRWAQVRLAPSARFEKDLREKKNNLYEQIIDLEIQTLQEIKNDILPSYIEQVVRELSNSRRIFIVGMRSSFSLAFLFHYFLSRTFPRSVLLDTAQGMIYDRMIEAGPGDTLLAISVSPYSKDTLRIVKFAKKNGCRVIAITDSVLSPIVQFSDFVLQAKVQALHQTFFISYISVACLINCLLAGIALADSNRSLQTLKEIEKKIPAGEVWEKIP